jgi:hypothetical protein
MKNKKYDEIYKKSQNKMKFLDKNKIVVVLQRSHCVKYKKYCNIFCFNR